MERSAGLQRLEGVLLVRSVLVDNEQIVGQPHLTKRRTDAAQTRNQSKTRSKQNMRALASVHTARLSLGYTPTCLVLT